MLAVWDALEADFLRDYGLELTRALPDMTWRQFLAYARNLRADGAVHARLRATRDTEDERQRAAEFFSSIVGGCGPDAEMV